MNISASRVMTSVKQRGVREKLAEAQVDKMWFPLLSGNNNDKEIQASVEKALSSVSVTSRALVGGTFSVGIRLSWMEEILREAVLIQPTLFPTDLYLDHNNVWRNTVIASHRGLSTQLSGETSHWLYLFHIQSPLRPYHKCHHMQRRVFWMPGCINGAEHSGLYLVKWP